jgi:hypothetical protein
MKNATSLISQSHHANVTGQLDGSAAMLNDLLSDLAELAGQTVNAGQSPMLELQFGNVVTRTVLSEVGAIPFLSVTVLLPESAPLKYISPPGQSATRFIGAGSRAIVWNAEEKCYVVDYKIDIVALVDECSFMDAILDCADQAMAQFTLMRSLGNDEQSRFFLQANMDGRNPVLYAGKKTHDDNRNGANPPLATGHNARDCEPSRRH